MRKKTAYIAAISGLVLGLSSPALPAQTATASEEHVYAQEAPSALWLPNTWQSTASRAIKYASRWYWALPGTLVEYDETSASYTMYSLAIVNPYRLLRQDIANIGDELFISGGSNLLVFNMKTRQFTKPLFDGDNPGIIVQDPYTGDLWFPEYCCTLNYFSAAKKVWSQPLNQAAALPLIKQRPPQLENLKIVFDINHVWLYASDKALMFYKRSGILQPDYDTISTETRFELAAVSKKHVFAFNSVDNPPRTHMFTIDKSDRRPQILTDNDSAETRQLFLSELPEMAWNGNFVMTLCGGNNPECKAYNKTVTRVIKGKTIQENDDGFSNYIFRNTLFIRRTPFEKPIARQVTMLPEMRYSQILAELENGKLLLRVNETFAVLTTSSHTIKYFTKPGFNMGDEARCIYYDKSHGKVEIYTQSPSIHEDELWEDDDALGAKMQIELDLASMKTTVKKTFDAGIGYPCPKGSKRVTNELRLSSGGTARMQLGGLVITHSK